MRIPLSAFPGVDLTDVRSIRFNFDQRSTGAVVLTDLMFANQSLGMAVVSSSPAEGEVVVSTTPPTSFVVNFSDPYDPGTVQPADLEVNGIPADNVALTDDRKLTFSYTTSPIATQGVQTMEIARGAIQRLEDGLRSTPSPRTSGTMPSCCRSPPPPRRRLGRVPADDQAPPELQRALRPGQHRHQRPGHQPGHGHGLQAHRRRYRRVRALGHHGGHWRRAWLPAR